MKPCNEVCLLRISSVAASALSRWGAILYNNARIEYSTYSFERIFGNRNLDFTDLFRRSVAQLGRKGSKIDAGMSTVKRAAFAADD